MPRASSWSATAAAFAPDTHSAAISETAAAAEAAPPGAIQNASMPAAPGRNMRTGLSRVIVPLGAEGAAISTIGPIAPAPTAERSGRAAGSAADTEMTSGASTSAEEGSDTLVPAVNVTTARGGASPDPSAVTTKSPPPGNVPLTADRSIDGDGPVTLRATESGVTGTGAEPLARTDTAAGSICRLAGAAALGFPATSANAPPPMVTMPDAPPARAGESSETTRELPAPATPATATAPDPAALTAM